MYQLYAQLQKTFGATERVIELLNEKNEDISIQSKQQEIKTKIYGNVEFKNVAFSYPSRKEIQVLKDINFKANAGERRDCSSKLPCYCSKIKQIRN